MIEEKIAKKINEHFKPEAFFLENESHMHSGPRTESHFKIYLASDEFVDLSRVERQRLVNDLMKEEFEAGLHALSMRLRSLKEHSEKGVGDFISPTCASKVKG
ncbi:MAG: BolA family protein [Bdellovibrionales bacterium]